MAEAGGAETEVKPGVERQIPKASGERRIGLECAEATKRAPLSRTLRTVEIKCGD